MSKEYFTLNKASEANLNADKRILQCVTILLYFSLLLFHFRSTRAYVIVLPWQRILGIAWRFGLEQLVSCFD